MFYENYLRLCNGVGKAPTAVATELGFQKSAVTRWKHGCQPTDATRAKIADYFGVTTEELCAEQLPKSAVNGDEELTGYLEQLSARPELRMLFSVSKDATKADVEQAVAIIEALRRAREGG
ncbi:MAG TPA: helix-turn-helix transcriptional regulator [Candidatus Scatomorpha stercorigallinarum]|nr:helix-turn-helix transcriptional regulator [Candidatus Scatomorpha stercorigallinarum]